MMLFSALKLIKMFVKLCKRLKLLSTAGGVRNSGHSGDAEQTTNTVLCQINYFLDSPICLYQVGSQSKFVAVIEEN